MKEISEDFIINKYNNGLSSNQIAKILGVSKTPILKILNSHGLIRKKDRCKKINVIEKDSVFMVPKVCPSCGEVTHITASNPTIACRNYFNLLEKKSLCKKCSLDKQKGSGNPFFGKTHTKKTIEQISKSRKGKGVGDRNSMSNHENRKKVSNKLKEKWGSGNLEHMRKFFSDKMKQTIKDGKLKNTNKSKAESTIINEIRFMGFFPVQSYRVDTKICDIYVPELNLIIEYNGDYWHCNPKKYDKDYFNVKKNKYAWELWKYDKKKLELIKNFGYNLEVVWEDEYTSDKTIIKKIINKHDTKFKYAPKSSRKD
jgi:G:T-mismatch repair DNA endonuclease (very short patch repair protein)